MDLRDRLAATEARLADAEETLRALRGGEVDAVVVESDFGPHVYTLKSATEPYRLLVEQMHEGALTISAHGVILYCNQAFADMLGVGAERTVGSSMANFLARDDLARLLAPSGCGGEEMALERPDGSRAIALVSSAPLQSGDDAITCAVIRDITRQQLRLRYEAFVQSTSDAVFLLTPDLRIQTWNPGAQELFGHSAESIIGRQVRDLSIEGGASCEALVAEVERCGHAVSADGRRRGKDGKIVQAIITLTPMRDEAGQITSYAVVAHDITDRKRAEEHARLLMREVNHRSKNLLAVVQAVARQTAGQVDPKLFAELFSERLAGLAASHDLLVQSEWRGVETGDLVRSQLAHFADLIGSRITLDGPPVQLNSSAAQAMGMAVHELATNAAKHGALTSGTGSVSIRWDMLADREQPKFRMQWIEHGGPPPASPMQRGFGHRVIVDLAEHALDADVSLAYPPTGLIWQIEAPAERILVTAQQQAGPTCES